MIIAYEKKGFKHTTFPLVRYLEGKKICKVESLFDSIMFGILEMV